MSFDFFQEGIKEDNGIKFTADQQAFFQNKLLFLDPNKTNTIPLSQALSLLKFSGLPPATHKKIFSNLNLTNKGSFNYTEMKKILRGVALAQNRIEPSLINVNANIKTKLPVFHDDDSQSEQQSPPQNQQTYKAPPVHRQTTRNTPQQVHREPQQQQHQPQSRPPQKPSSHNETRQNPNDPIKKFEDFWSTLSVEHSDKISGSQVKKLFGNSNNRSALSKIWKLCNTTHKGYLTKGQLYIFVMLIKSKTAQIPSKLTHQMKDVIKKIDGHTSHKQTQTRSNSQIKNTQFFDDTHNNLSKSQSIHNHPQQKRQNRLRNKSSAQFDNFDFAAFGNNPKQQTYNNHHHQPQHQHQHQPQQQPNLRVSTATFEDNPSMKSPKFQNIHMPEIQSPPQITKANQQIPLTIYNKLAYQLNNIQTKIYPQIQKLSKSNKQSNDILEQTNALLNSFEQTHQNLTQKLVQLKRNQDGLNYRLNQTCIRMRDVIMRQSDFIAELLQCISQQANMNLDRVQVLQGYAGQVGDQVDDTINNYRKNTQNKAYSQPIQEHIQQTSKNIQVYEQPQQANQYDQNYRRSLQSMKQMSMSMSVSNKRKQQMSSIQDSVDTRKIRQMYGAQNYKQQLRQKLKNNQMTQQVYPQNDQQSDKQDQQKQHNFNKGAYHAEPVSAQPTNQNFQIKRTDSNENYAKNVQAEKIADNQFIQPNTQQNRISPAHQQPQQQMYNQNQQQNVDQQDDVLRLKKKQIFTIQLINYLAPIKQQQYPIILQRVTSMSQSQLDALYATLYKKYEIKLEQEKAAQQQPTNINPPTHDEFSSNNFRQYNINQAQIHQNKKQQVNFFE